jgi:exopolyphosphatase/guanosine-5'-triphosphate,3'-diphosphate pyrophosphatase
MTDAPGNEGRAPHEGAARGVVGAIDIGSNTTNLLIADAEGRTLERVETTTRLGRALSRTGRLSEESVARTVATLRDYRSLLDRHGARRVRVVATAASRQATNHREFFAAARDAVGVEPELLAGTEEGRLAYLGALTGLSDRDVPGPHLVLDIGGASTEVMVGDRNALHHVSSIDLGAVLVTESELHHDPPRPEELTNAIGAMHDELEEVSREHPEIGEAAATTGTMIGIAGTINTVAAVELGRWDPEAIHGMQLGRDAVEEVFRTLALESLDVRRHNPGLPPERADIIVGGCCILVAVMRRWQIRQLVVSTHGIREGVVAELLGTEAA